MSKLEIFWLGLLLFERITQLLGQNGKVLLNTFVIYRCLNRVFILKYWTWLKQRIRNKKKLDQ